MHAGKNSRNVMRGGGRCATVNKFTAITALNRIVLNRLGAEGAFLHGGNVAES
jgi:hypothetical protein